MAGPDLSPEAHPSREFGSVAESPGSPDFETVDASIPEATVQTGDVAVLDIAPPQEDVGLSDGHDGPGYEAVSTSAAGQNESATTASLALEEALQALSALTLKVDQMAAQSDVLARENSDLRASLDALEEAGRPPSLEDIDRLFKSKIYEPFSLVGSHRAALPKHLIIPIHPPKIGHVSNIFSRVDGHEKSEDVLLTFVTTTAGERALMERYIALTHPQIPVAYEVISAMELADGMGFSLLSAEMGRSEAAIINIKKMLGLYRAFYLGAQEVICMDSDAIFLAAPDDLFETARRNYERKVFMASYSPIEITDQVVLASASYFPEDESRRLRALIGVGQFSWFFDAPYYPATDGREFLAHISLAHGGMERALLALTWHTFDHVLFINYLLLRGDFELVDVRRLVGADKISDDLSLMDLRAIEAEHGYRPAWAPLPAMLSLPEAEGEGQYVVAFHVDRVSTASVPVG